MSEKRREARDVLSEQLVGSRRQFLTRAAKAGLVATTGPAFLAACGGGEEDGGGGGGGPERKQIGYDFPFNTIPVYGALTKFAKERAQQTGYELLLTADEGKIERQINNVRTWITQRVPALVVYPMEASTMETLAQEARQKGLKWVTYAEHMKNEDGAILFSNEQSGRLLGTEAAKHINQQLGGEAEVALLTYDEVSVGRERKKGELAALKELAPGAKIVAQAKANATDTGVRVTESILEAHPNLKVIIPINDDAGLGAYQVLVNRGKAKDPDYWVGGQDGTIDALKTVQKGEAFRATVAVRLKDIGYAIIDLPRRLLEGGSGGTVNIKPVVLKKGSPQIKEYMSDWQ